MNRRTFLGIAGLAIGSGCIGDGGGGSESTEDIATTTVPPEGSGTTTGRVTTSETLCAKTIQLDSLSQKAQEEFTTAREKGELLQPEEEFQLPMEVSTVNDEIGYETCIKYENKRYYGIYGSYGDEGQYMLTINLVNNETVGN